MNPVSAAPAASEEHHEMVVAIAQSIAQIVPSGMPEYLAVGGALAYVIELASTSPNKARYAAVLRSAADQLELPPEFAFLPSH